MPGERSSLSLRRSSGVNQDSNNPSRQHTRGSSTSTSIPQPSYAYQDYPPTAALSSSYKVDEHEELSVDFEESIHLNSLGDTPTGKGREYYDNDNMARGGGSSYSSLPTSNSASSAGGSKRRGGGVGRAEGRWASLAKWQKNALILGGILIVGLIFLNSGKGSTGLSSSTSDRKEGGGTATSEEDSRVVARPNALPKEQQAQAVPSNQQQQQQQPAGTSETGLAAAANPAPHSDAKQPSSADGTCRLPTGKPEFQYALMIDAGSTGSRMHVYKFSNCLPASAPSTTEDALPTLVDELFYPITPGLSSYRGRPLAAAESLTKLMEEAVKAVPKEERACTPIAVKATAGLRMLGAKESQDILDEVERWLKKEWPFQVVEDGVVIMDGKDEGVYAWITINYLLGLIGPGKKAGQSAAVMDLGGASTQIVFEPAFPSTSKLSPGDHVYDLNFASEDHTLYQHSHLGYGLMQARRSVHNLVAFTHVWLSTTKGGSTHKEWEDLTENDLIHTPCLVKGGKKTVLLDPPGRKAVNVTLLGTGAGFDACRRIVDVVMAKDALCETEPCAFGGVYQPKLMDTFGTGPIYALSYFYDRIVPLGLGKDGKPFTIADLRDLTNDVCAGPNPSGSSSSTTGSSSATKGWSRFEGNLEAMEELKDRPEYCLDLSFMYSLLSLGYELAPERELVTGKKINDIELGWALGAGIALLEHSSLHCRNPDA